MEAWIKYCSRILCNIKLSSNSTVVSTLELKQLVTELIDRKVINDFADQLIVIYQLKLTIIDWLQLHKCKDLLLVSAFILP